MAVKSNKVVLYDPTLGIGTDEDVIVSVDIGSTVSLEILGASGTATFKVSDNGTDWVCRGLIDLKTFSTVKEGEIEDGDTTLYMIVPDATYIKCEGCSGFDRITAILN